MRNLVLNGESLELTLLRMAHEIAESSMPGDDLVLVGIQRGGVAVARRLNAQLSSILGICVPLGTLDVTMHRDDLDWHRVPEMHPTEIPFDLDSRNVVLVDDVLYHGRTVRAALDALHELGRPKCVQLAVLIDRGHRRLPIHADFVGRQISTQTRERVFVRLGNEPGTGEVWLAESPTSGS